MGQGRVDQTGGQRFYPPWSAAEGPLCDCSVGWAASLKLAGSPHPTAGLKRGPLESPIKAGPNSSALPLLVRGAAAAAGVPAGGAGSFTCLHFRTLVFEAIAADRFETPAPWFLRRARATCVGGPVVTAGPHHARMGLVPFATPCHLLYDSGALSARGAGRAFGACGGVRRPPACWACPSPSRLLAGPAVSFIQLPLTHPPLCLPPSCLRSARGAAFTY